MDDGKALRLAAVARKWLENPRVGYEYDGEDAGANRGHAISSLVQWCWRVSLAEPGRVVCSLRVPPQLTDADGRWHAGAIAAAVDNMCSATIFTVEGAPTFTVHYALSYFSPAAQNEEIEMDGRVVGQKGKLTAAVVEVRKMESGELVAAGRQWMTSTRPKKSIDSRSKL